MKKIIKGDRFRTDFGGEGGAGYKTAPALLEVFGIDELYHDEMMDFSEI